VNAPGPGGRSAASLLAVHHAMLALHQRDHRRRTKDKFRFLNLFVFKDIIRDRRPLQSARLYCDHDMRNRVVGEFYTGDVRRGAISLDKSQTVNYGTDISSEGCWYR
jgi:hypothetical protein